MSNNNRIKVKKIEREHAEDIVALRKQFEIRNDGGSYSEGDILALCIQDNGIYSSEVILTKVVYKSNYGQQEDYVVLGLTYPVLTIDELKFLVEVVNTKLNKGGIL